MKALQFGLLGTARINQALIPALRASPRSRLVGVASRSAERAEAYGRQWGIERTFSSYDAMLADTEIQAVYIPLPNSLHAPWTIRAVRAGKHVLCEKPLALTIEDCDAVAVAAREAGVVVAEAFMYRHHPQTAQVREIVASGALGAVRLVRGSFTFPLTRQGDVRLDPRLGGGSLWDVGCYPLGFARTVLGQEPIEAFGWQHTGPTGVDLTFAAQLRFPGDTLVQFDCSFEVPFRAEMEIVGAEATLTVLQPFKPGAEASLLLRRGDRTDTIGVEQAGLYVGEVEDLAAAALDGKPPLVSLADSRANVAALQALLRSAREKRPVPIS